MAPILVLLVVVAVLIPAPVSAESGAGTAVIPAGGHLVLLNFTVAGDHRQDPYNAGNVRYLVFLEEGSPQDRFDVYVMTLGSYMAYVAGGDHRPEVGWGCESAGEMPAYALVYLFEPGDYVLLIDNTELGEGPYSPAELRVRYEYEARNVDVPREARWDLFMALMLLVALLGAAFLLLLDLWVKHRMQRVDSERRRRCANCGRVSVSDGAYCPYCGRER